jgi:hypothetical protein
MKTLTKNEARAGSMTIEEAGVGTFDRALQLQGASVALLSQSSTQVGDWEHMLKIWAENVPWAHLPEGSEKKYENWHAWTGAELKFNGQALTKKRFIQLLAGLYGTSAKACKVVSDFEETIGQPQFTTHGGKREEQGVAQHLDLPKRGSTNVEYLMQRLLKIDPDIESKIGQGLEYPSINAAAVALGLIKETQRYQLTTGTNTTVAAARIVDLLGNAKAAELISAMTLLLTSHA